MGAGIEIDVPMRSRILDMLRNKAISTYWRLVYAFLVAIFAFGWILTRWGLDIYLNSASCLALDVFLGNLCEEITHSGVPGVSLESPDNWWVGSYKFKPQAVIPPNTEKEDTSTEKVVVKGRENTSESVNNDHFGPALIIFPTSGLVLRQVIYRGYIGVWYTCSAQICAWEIY